MAPMVIQRGQVYYVNFDMEGGSSMQKTRPAVVVQNNAGNAHSSYTIVVAMAHDSEKPLPVRVAIPKGIAGLTKNSVADCGHVKTIKQDRLLRYCGTLPNHYLSQVDRALAVSLGLRLRNV